MSIPVLEDYSFSFSFLSNYDWLCVCVCVCDNNTAAATAGGLRMSSFKLWLRNFRGLEKKVEFPRRFTHTLIYYFRKNNYFDKR
jgi:hypothetical protein